jgi:hypothetical protein
VVEVLHQRTLGHHRDRVEGAHLVRGQRRGVAIEAVRAVKRRQPRERRVLFTTVTPSPVDLAE